MHLSQRASWSSCKIFKPCLKMFERAEPHPTSSNPQCRAQGRLKTPEVVCFPCLCDVMKFMDILPIEIWISKWSNLFVGKTSKSARTSAIKQGVGCWSSELSTFTRPTSGIFKSISLLCLQTSYPKSTTYVKKKEFCVLPHLLPYDCPPSIIPESWMRFNGGMTTNQQKGGHGALEFIHTWVIHVPQHTPTFPQMILMFWEHAKQLLCQQHG